MQKNGHLLLNESTIEKVHGICTWILSCAQDQGCTRGKTNKFIKQKIAVEDMIPSNSKAQLVLQNYCSHLFNLDKLFKKKIEHSNYFTSLIQ